MAYQSLYRRYRPRRFSELKGQPHVVRALSNAVKEDRVGHAYLFSGPRGTGKTSTARILAKALNCEHPVEGEPDGTCPSCVAVDAGTSFDVHELDAASNNGVENIRELIERANLATPGRTKVYILDEVHMLSKAAEAALLKTLEEPPPHVVFVLATTDPQKVTATIRSRCQPFEFHLLPADELGAHVRWVMADAGLQLPEDAVEAVLRQGKGSARDTLSALDQVVAAGGVTSEDAPIDEIIEALADQDAGRALTAVATAMRTGRDARSLAEAVVTQLRDAFLARTAPGLVQLGEQARARVASQGERLGLAATVRGMEVLGEAMVEMRHAPDPRVLLDVAVVRLTSHQADVSPAALAARLERVEQALAGGAPVRPAESAPRSRPQPGAAAAPGPAVPPTPSPTAAATEAPPAATTGRRAPSPAVAAAAPVEAASGGRARLGARAGSTRPPAAPERGEPPAPAVPEAPAEASAPTRRVGGDGPTREELTLAWADEVVPELKKLAKPLYAAARWVDGPAGAPVLAMPNDAHRKRSEPYLAEVEAALAARFGRPVPVRLVLDEGQVAEAADGADPDDIDLDDLLPAAPAGSVVDRVAAAFPGSELVDEG